MNVGEFWQSEEYVSKQLKNPCKESAVLIHFA